MANEKIIQLFEYRKLPYLIEFFSKSDRKKILSSLIELQKSIYELDCYLECNWNLRQSDLDKYWEDIYNKIEKLGYDRSNAFQMCSHIRRYQLHETQLRELKFPMRLNQEYFYYYKSCDVRLMREILFDKCKNLRVSHKLSDWRLFDLVTEINDDIEDIEEDLHTINCNAFMISILEKGSSISVSTYKKFLKALVAKSELRALKRHNKWYQQINSWTITDAQLTLELINKKQKLGLLNIKKGDCKLYSLY